VAGLALAWHPNLAQEALMDFGLFYYCQGQGAPHDQAYAEMLDQIALAECLGFGECWFAEHHFTDYSLLLSPNLMIASGIQRTRRMRFGNYVNALPFHLWRAWVGGGGRWPCISRRRRW
jgi:Luciferase-like monooxygenase